MSNVTSSYRKAGTPKAPLWRELGLSRLGEEPEGYGWLNMSFFKARHKVFVTGVRIKFVKKSTFFFCCVINDFSRDACFLTPIASVSFILFTTELFHCVRLTCHRTSPCLTVCPVNPLLMTSVNRGGIPLPWHQPIEGVFPFMTSSLEGVSLTYATHLSLTTWSTWWCHHFIDHFE